MTLHWPTGAARHAVCYVLTTDAELALIRSALSQGGSTFVPVDFVLDDGTRSLTTPLWMLPARPLHPPGGSNRVWLLTLVDDRYFWPMQAADIPAVASWTDLYALLGTALGVGITVDAIPAAYGVPTVDFAASYTDLPTLLDAVARTVGQRIVRDFEGNVAALNVGTSKARVADNLNNLAPVNGIMAGGILALSNPPPNDLSSVIPASFTVVFPRTGSGGPGGTVTPYPVSLASLALPEFSGVMGFVGSKVVHNPTVAVWTGSSAPSNDSALLALARQTATDWYRYQAAALDLTYSGIADWEPEGLSDSIEWSHSPEPTLIKTRVQRPPWNDLDEGMIPPDGLRVQDDTGTPSYSPVNLLDFHSSDFIVSQTMPREAHIALRGGSGGGPGGGTSLTVQNLDGSGRTLNVDTIDANQYSGIRALNLAPGVAELYIEWVDTSITVITSLGITIGVVSFPSSFYYTFNGPLEICGDQYWCCVSVGDWTSNQDNYLLPDHKTVYKIGAHGSGTDGDGIIKLGGVVPNVPGLDAAPQFLVLYNDSTNPIRVLSNGQNSLDVNRILVAGGGRHDAPGPGAAALNMFPGDTIGCWYDTCDTTPHWRPLFYTCTFGPSGDHHGPGMVPDPGPDRNTTCGGRFLWEGCDWLNPLEGGQTQGVLVLGSVSFDKATCTLSGTPCCINFSCGLFISTTCGSC